MARDFHHPDRGDWQTLTDTDAAAYPAGTVALPPRPGPGHSWDAGQGAWVAPPAPVAVADPLIKALELITAELAEPARAAIVAEIAAAKLQRGIV